MLKHARATFPEQPLHAVMGGLHLSGVNEEIIPQTVQAILRGHLAALDGAAKDPAQARTVVNDGLKKLTGSALAGPVIDRAFSDITLTDDPLAATFPQLAKDSVTAGVTSKPTDLAGFLDVTPLNTVLQGAGKPAVSAAGLDKAGGSS